MPFSDMSLPSRERGLKFKFTSDIFSETSVAPFAGAWIEIAWSDIAKEDKPSLPSRERGLKCK